MRMKMLTLAAVLCAVMALSRAAAVPEAAAEAPSADAAEGQSPVVKRSTACPGGWSLFNGRCFFFVSRDLSWAQAERNCQNLGGNLASVRNNQEYHFLQRLTAGHGYPGTWIGGSDAEHEGYWFWSDGSSFHYTNWCPGEPNNKRYQHCLHINFGDAKCWDDLQCEQHHPSICAKRV